MKTMSGLDTAAYVFFDNRYWEFTLALLQYELDFLKEYTSSKSLKKNGCNSYKIQQQTKGSSFVRILEDLL